jgi:hypothetical protein
MRLVGTLAVAVLACAAPARAQNSTEIGVSVDGLLSWWSAFPPQVALRVTLPSSGRSAVEMFVSTGRTDGFFASGDYGGVYGAQVRRRVGRLDRDGARPFVTFGGFGGYVHGKYDSYVSPPFVGVIGAGAEWPVARRLNVRVEAQGVMALIIPVGVHIAASGSVPIGRLR